MLTPWKESSDQPRQHIKNQRHYFAHKVPSSQGYGFFSSHVWMWELDHKESWAPKNWCFWTMVLEKTLESPVDCKEIQSVLPKGDQSWVLIGRIDAEAETPILWPPDVKNWLIGKDPDAGKDWRREEKGTTEDKMAGWHHQLDGRESEHAPGVGEASCALCAYWSSVYLLWRNVYLDLLPIYWLGCLFVFFYIKLCELLYILEINHWLVTLFANIFSQSLGCFFVNVVYGFLYCVKTFKFN